MDGDFQRGQMKGEMMPSIRTPKISVVLITYNFARYLRECIESLLRQTLRPFEIVICDDCSIDESWSIISKYSKRYPGLIRSYRNERNIGVAANKNIGLKRARGNLITWLDGDDRWLPRKLELEWKALQRHPEARIAYSNVYTIDAEGNRTGIWHNSKEPALPIGDVFVEVFSKRFFHNTRSVFRNELRYCSDLEAVGYDDLNLQSYWDWDEKIRLSARFHAVYSGEALIEYRRHAEGFSEKDAEMHFRAMVQIYEKHLPLLDRVSKKECVRIRSNVESILALQQVRLPPSELLSYYSAPNVYERNRKLLDQLPKQDRVPLKKELFIPFMWFALKAGRDELKRGQIRHGIKYGLDFFRYNRKEVGLMPIARIMLSKLTYTRMRAVYRYFGSLP